MGLLNGQSEDYDFLRVVSRLIRTNPFSPRWVELEKEALGADFSPAPRVHLWTEERKREHPNLTRIYDRITALAPVLRERLCSGARLTRAESPLYRDVVLAYLYRRHRKSLEELIKHGRNNGARTLWKKFSDEFNSFFPPAASESAHRLRGEDIFAIFFQVRRAFFHIFYHIVGTSESITRLQEDVWNSIFTHDMQRYNASLRTRMNSFHTLITGPSGSGKELVARAIGLSQYIPVCAEANDIFPHFSDSFHALNLVGVPSTLVESELFGHAQGAFTGAVVAQPGWLETANNWDTVFLDEIGELQHSLQAKLLRALETRKFCRVGDRVERDWKGKVIAATNRDLIRAVGKGDFREDLYYRLCGDVIETPSLRSQLNESPGDLEHLVFSATERVIGKHDKAITSDVTNWIAETCLPTIPGEETSASWSSACGIFSFGEDTMGGADPADPVLLTHERGTNATTSGELEVSTPDLVREFCHLVFEKTGNHLSKADLERYYFQAVYAETGTYRAAATQLGVDERTVKKHVQGSEGGRTLPSSHLSPTKPR